jgi:hypothetical protein
VTTPALAWGRRAEPIGIHNALPRAQRLHHASRLRDAAARPLAFGDAENARD